VAPGTEEDPGEESELVVEDEPTRAASLHDEVLGDAAVETVAGEQLGDEDGLARTVAHLPRLVARRTDDRSASPALDAPGFAFLLDAVPHCAFVVRLCQMTTIARSCAGADCATHH